MFRSCNVGSRRDVCLWHADARPVYWPSVVDTYHPETVTLAQRWTKCYPANTRRWNKAGLMSATPAQYQTSIGWTCGVCWAIDQESPWMMTWVWGGGERPLTSNRTWRRVIWCANICQYPHNLLIAASANITLYPANTTHLPNVWPMLAHCRVYMGLCDM